MPAVAAVDAGFLVNCTLYTCSGVFISNKSFANILVLVQLVGL